MKIVVAGTGYVGLVTGVAMAHMGHNVTCVDVSEEKIKILNSGKSPIYEQDLEEEMLKYKNNLTYTLDYKSAYKDADVIFIGVGTPEKSDGSANLSYVYSVCDNIIESIEKDCIIVIKSTVPIGTNDTIENYIRNNLNKNIQVDVVSNPEFLAQGTAVRDTLYASRIVVGVENDRAKKIMEEVYLPFTKEPYNVPYLVVNRRSAEMIKYASNDFLALKIAYICEIANFCEEVGADIEDVTKGMGYDSRIGNKFLKAGIGYGGSCFPKDTKALHWLSCELDGDELQTVKSTIEINKNQKIRLFKKLLNDFKNIEGKNISILGLTFKPGTDDLREAPSIDNINLLLDYNANVTVYDPIGMANFKKIFGDRVKYATSIDKCINSADAVMIMTEWEEFVNYPLKNYEDLMKTPYIYDGRNCYNLDEIRKYKLCYQSIGRCKINNIN